jgi:hypothetical protein
VERAAKAMEEVESMLRETMYCYEVKWDLERWGEAITRLDGAIEQYQQTYDKCLIAGDERPEPPGDR